MTNNLGAKIVAMILCIKVNNKLFYILLLLTGILSGCASHLIEVKKGSDQIVIVDADKISGCELKGKVNVSVLSKIGFITRNKEDVEANLDQLARNNALEMQGNTIVKLDSSEFGRREYSIYKCKI